MSAKIVLAIEIVKLAGDVFGWVLKKKDPKKTHIIAKSNKAYTRKHSAVKGAERFAKNINRKIDIA